MKAAGGRMRRASALLRELPPSSICGSATAVPRRLPIDEFLRIFNGCAANADTQSGLMFSGAAHIPFIDELPSAWTGLRRDVNYSHFVMWDKGGSDTLFSLWKDGISPALFPQLTLQPPLTPRPSPLSCRVATAPQPLQLSHNLLPSSLRYFLQERAHCPHRAGALLAAPPHRRAAAA